MNKLVLLISFIILIVLFGSSCQREILPDLNDTTTINPASVLRRIKVYHPSATDPLDIALTFQYDTPGRKLNIYLDDTTTTNSFDLLAATYQFDANGYLVSSSIIDLNSIVLHPDFTIIRNNNGQIQKIIEFDAEEINGVSYNDTVYYSYQQSGTQTIIKDSVLLYPFTYFTTRQTIYNSQNKPVSETYPSQYSFGPFNYTYYSNGTVSRITSGSDTTDFTYDNAIVAKEWESLPSLLLGKDFYILQQPALTGRLNYHFLTFIIESEFESTYNPFLTQPLAKLIRHGLKFFSLTPTSKIVNFTTTYTANKFPATLSVLPVGDDPFYYTFEYK